MVGTMQNVRTKKFPKQRHFLAVFFLSFMWGIVGVDRMYLGKWGTGFLKLVTLGGLGIWVLTDLTMIMAGTMRDKQGREMLQFAEYKGFAYKTALLFALAVGVIVLINALFLLAAIMQLMNGIQDGNIPGLDFLNGFNSLNGLSPDQAQELGL